MSIAKANSEDERIESLKEELDAEFETDASGASDVADTQTGNKYYCTYRPTCVLTTRAGC